MKIHYLGSVSVPAPFRLANPIAMAAVGSRLSGSTTRRSGIDDLGFACVGAEQSRIAEQSRNAERLWIVERELSGGSAGSKATAGAPSHNTINSMQVMSAKNLGTSASAVRDPKLPVGRTHKVQQGDARGIPPRGRPV